MQNGRVKLKKISLLGFKSFADKTQVSFGEGINAVVGPNGCGKSNIADAFRWVLGEQSARSLRGGKMEDILFAGSEKRKPMNMVEVSLTFENSDKVLSLPYKEIEITRRYYRGGDGEYLIAQNPVRLKDVQSLMMELDLGKNPYVIFEQGKIDQIVLMSKEERRALFEEAAGIVCFLVSKKEALKKLEEAKSHIDRVQDLQKSASRQIALLQKEAEEAKFYLQLKNEILELEKRVFSSKISKKKSEFTSASATLGSSKTQFLSLQQELEQKRLQREALTQKSSQMRSELEALFAHYSQQDKAVSLLEAEKKSLAEKKTPLLIEEKHHQSFLSQRETASPAQKQKKNQTLSLLENKKEEQTLLLKSLNEIAPQRKKADDALYASRKKLDEVQSQALLTLRKKSEQEGSKKRHETVIEISQNRLDHLRENQLLLSQQLQQKQKEAKTHEALTKALLDEKASLEQALKSSKDKNKLLFTEEKELLQIGEALQQSLSKNSANLGLLAKMREDKEGIGKGAKLLQKKFPHLRPLFEEISPPDDPIHIALLRPYEATLIVSACQEREEIIAYALQENIRGFSLLCKEEIDLPLEQHLLQHFIFEELPLTSSFSDKTKPLVDRLKNLLVDDRKVLFSLNDTPDSWLDTIKRERLLETQVQEEKKKYDGYLAQKNGFYENKDQLHHGLLELEKQQRLLEKKQIEHHFSSVKIQSETAQLQKELAFLQTEQDNLLSKIADAQLLLQTASPQPVNSTFSTDVPEQEIHHYKKLLDEKIREASSIKRIQEEKEKTLSLLEREIGNLEHLLEIHLLHEKEDAQKTSHAQSRLESLRHELLSINALFQQNELSLQENQSQQQTLSHTYHSQKKEHDMREVDLHQAAKEFDLLAHKEKEAHSLLHQKELLQQALTTEITTMTSEYIERYQTPPEDTPQLPIQELEKELKQKRTLFEKLPHVNLAAEETLQKEMSVACDLSAKIDDLLQAEGQLLSHLQELEAKSRLLFEETFQKIRNSFQKNFAILFEGGEADLLIEGDDLLSSKIDILARPPGKKLQSITLLSGGERCLTAMALLFSIFEVKVSPFCILDEIDAPLDEANVHRFANLLEAFKQKTQFILITHNKKTMSISDRLLGVSMQEKGVSKMIMMEFMNREVAAL